MLDLIGLRVCSKLTTFQTGWIFAAVEQHQGRVKIAFPPLQSAGLSRYHVLSLGGRQ